MLICYGLEFLATWLECAIGILSVSAFSLKKRANRKHFLIASVVLSILILGCNQVKLLSVYATVSGILGIAVASSIFSGMKFKDSFILSIVYVIIIYIIDFFSISVLSLVFKNKDFGMQVIQGYSMWRICHLILTKIFLLVMYFLVLKKISGKVILIPKKMWGITVILAILVAYFGEKTIRGTENQMLVIWLFFSFFIILYSHVGVQYFEYCKAREYAKIAEARNVILAKKYEDLIKNYRNNQIQSHDLKNHYLIIKELVRHKEFERLEKYIEMLGDTKSSISFEIWTGISILDQLLQYKKEEAERKNIRFDITSDKIELKLNETEIVALFGNALDNAMEACEKMKKVRDGSVLRYAKSIIWYLLKS